MDIRTVTLQIHLLPSGRAYWALSIDRGRGRRFVLLRGLLEDVDEPGYAPVSLLVSEAAGAVRRAHTE